MNGVAEFQPEDPHKEAAPPVNVRSARATALSLSAVAFAGLAAFVFLNDRYGAPLVNGLTGRVGELAADEAKSLAMSGDLNGAISQYRKSLTARFESPQQRQWALRSLGELLVQTQQNAEAAIVLEEAVQVSPRDTVALGLLCRSYRSLERYDDMLAVALRWDKVVAQRPNPTAVADVRLHVGEAQEHLGNLKAALQAYTTGAQANNSSDCAYRAAVLLSEAGDRAEARALLLPYIATASGARHRDAEALLASLEGTAP